MLIKGFLSNNPFLPVNISGSRSDHLQVVSVPLYHLTLVRQYHSIFSPRQTELPPVSEDYSKQLGMMTARPGQARRYQAKGYQLTFQNIN